MREGRVVSVGGGLANSLIAYRLAQTRPDLEPLIVEADQLGGNHTWCFHATDLTPAQREWVAPLVERQWDGYTVRFPNRTRQLGLRYCCVTADRLRDVLGTALNRPLLRARATEVGANSVTLEDGGTLEADLVLDGRGAGDMRDWGLAWQVFLGMQVRLAAPHGLAAPIVMDATVAQDGSYRFFYCLPWSADELLIEDTRYQDGARLDPARMRSEVLAYAKAQGWRVLSVVREEQGVLPIVLSGRPEWPESGPVPVGMRAGLFPSGDRLFAAGLRQAGRCDSRRAGAHDGGHPPDRARGDGAPLASARLLQAAQPHAVHGRRA
jgi:lycopene beta-cyclase